MLFGGGFINDMINYMMFYYFLFGGVGDSGMGVYYGKVSFDIFLYVKSILKCLNK